MKYTVRTIDREFTPAEAGDITGVSPALQRDWRRRKILPESKDGKWTRWSLSDVIQLSVMKRLSDTGVDVSKTLDAARMAILPTLSRIKMAEGAVTFEGDDLPENLMASMALSEGTVTRMSDGTPGPDVGIYLFIGRDIDSGETLTARVPNLAAIDDLLAQRAVPLFTVIDCAVLALEIFDRGGGRPLVRVEVEATAE